MTHKFNYDDFCTLLDFIDSILKECETAETKEIFEECKKGCVPTEQKSSETSKAKQPVYNKLTDKVFCLDDNSFMFINNNGDASQFLNFGTEGATITDNQLLVALLYRYRNDVRKYNYVKELLV